MAEYLWEGFEGRFDAYLRDSRLFGISLRHARFGPSKLVSQQPAKQQANNKLTSKRVASEPGNQ